MILWVVLDKDDKFVSVHIKSADAQHVIDVDDRSVSPRGLFMVAKRVV